MRSGTITKTASVLILLATSTCLVAQQKTESPTSHPEQVETTTGEATVRAYEAGEVLELISTDMVLPYSAARQWINDRVDSICDRGTSATTCAWHEKRVIVKADGQQHEKIQKLFANLKANGMRAISIQSRVLRVPQSEFSKLEVAWQPIPNDATESAITRRGDESVVTASTNTTTAASRVLAALHAQKDELLEQDLVVAARRGLSAIPSELKRPAGTNGSNWSVASSVVRRSTPVLFSVLAPDQHAALIARISANKKIEREFHPKLIVFNGVQASIDNSIERQFVTRLKAKRLIVNDRPQVSFQPKLESFEEGIKIKLLPEMFSDEEIRLTYHMKLCNFRSVDVLELPRFDGQTNYRVQVPEVATTQFSTRVDIPLNYSLIVCAFEKNKEGETDAVVVVSQCQVAKPPAQEEAADSEVTSTN